MEAAMLEPIIKDDNIECEMLVSKVGGSDSITSGNNNARKAARQHDRFISDFQRGGQWCTAFANECRSGGDAFVPTSENTYAVPALLQTLCKPERERCLTRPANREIPNADHVERRVSHRQHAEIVQRCTHAHRERKKKRQRGERSPADA